MDIKELVQLSAGEIIEFRRYIHQYPDLSGQEHNTMNKICEYLDKYGIAYKKNVAETGVVAYIRGQSEDTVVGLRGDIDALPMKEETGLPFASKNKGVMHSCGHDIHTAVLLGTAKVLKLLEKDLKGSVKFFFQPAEETVGGAERMIKEGCLENPYVEACFGLHVGNRVDTGKISLKYGKLNASSDVITIILRGLGSHGAHPSGSIDPIVMSAAVVMNLQTLVSRNTSPTDSVVFTVGSIHGGTKGNIIPDEVRMECILRTLDPATRKKSKERVREIVENTAKAYGGKAEIIINESYTSLINDNEMVDFVKSVAYEVLGPENVVMSEEASMGAEDFAYFAEARKSCFFGLGCRNEAKGCIHPGHNSKFNPDEDCIAVGMEMQIHTVIKYFENKNKL